VDPEHPHGVGGVATLSSRPEPGMKDSAAAWFATRLELVALEAREAARLAVKRGLLAGFFGGMVMFAWVSLMAGGIGWISVGTGIAWYWVAMMVAGLHGVVAVVVGVVFARCGFPVFETTRSELEKDLLWLEDLHRRIKS